jgi:hypothetical protein
MSTFPNALDNLSTNHQDGVNEIILAATANGLASATNAVQSFLLQTVYGVQSIPFNTPITPNAALGWFVQVGALTANITVNNPATPIQAGQTLTFAFVQDGTGGRTITWGSAYKVSWSPSTTANLRNTITFRYDGTSWIQQSVATGLPA